MEKNACVGLTAGSSSAITKEKRRNCTLYRNSQEASRSVIARSSRASLKKIKLPFKTGRQHKHAFQSNTEIDTDFSYEGENEHSDWHIYNNSEYDFVTATCQLLVNPGTDITEVLKHPDSSVSWADVAEVRFFQTESTNCPICLYPPVAPRVGPCGHIYCLPCIWIFIDYENDILSKKCAVCNIFLRKSELKRVRLCPVDVPCVGQSCNLVLMHRYRSVNFPTTYENATHAGESLCVSMVDLPVSLFSRVSIATAENLKNLIQRDISVMETYIAESQLDVYNSTMVPIAEEILITLMTEMNEYLSTNQSKSLSDNRFPLNIGDPNRSFTYYEDINGFDIYLHNMNWRCLTLEYKDKNLPKCISGQVVEVECYTVTYEFRRRYRYLSHLPIGRSIYFVELDLQPPIVSVETLKTLSEVIGARLKKRQSKLQIEKSLTRAKEEAENRIQSLPLGSTLRGHVNLQDVVPTDADFVALSPVSATNFSCPPLLRSFASVSKIGASNVVDRHRIANFAYVGEQAQWFETDTESWPSLCAGSSQATNSSNLEEAAAATSSTSTMNADPPLSEVTATVSACKRRLRRNKKPKSILDLASLSFINSSP